MATIPNPLSVKITDEAYRAFPGPILVLAGPGTGKTYQLARRIEFLTSEIGAKADQITIITFTKEAAYSMRRKIEEQGAVEFIPDANRPVRISTMHSLGHAIISENVRFVGLRSDFKLVEDDETRDILFQDAALNAGFDYDKGKIAKKDRETGSRTLSEESKIITREYESILRHCNAIDYDDQILLAIQLLRSNEKARQKWQAEARFLLIDEYQDINPAQFELICLLSELHRAGLFVVGDDDQSIYHFRGGSPRFIREFTNHFGPTAQIIQMATSRRCKRSILDAANSLIVLHDKDRIPKVTPIFEQEDTGEVVIHNCPSDQREATIVATIIKREIEKGENEPRSSFILVPNRNYVPCIDKALTHANIPFSVQASESKPLRHLFTIEEWCQQPASDLLTRLIIQFAVDVGTLHIPSSMAKNPDKLKDRKDALLEIARLWKSQESGVQSLVAVLTQSTHSTLKEVADILEAIKKAHTKDFGEFLRLVQKHCKPWPSRKAFFDEMKSIERSKKRPSQSGLHTVRIMTMQNCKGLQADFVFIVGLEEETLPRGQSDEEVSEDARLLFVAITRGIDVVHLFHARLREGAVTFNEQSYGLKESRFLKNLPGKRQYHPAK